MSTEMRPGTRGLEWGSVLQIFALALVIATLSEWMGALPINLGVGKVVLLPMIWALLIGLVLGLLRKWAGVWCCRSWAIWWAAS